MVSRGDDTMKINWRKLLVAILIPLAVGGLSALITSDSMQQFGALNQPPLSPPAWLFPVVWTVLYILMGVASYLVAVQPKDSTLALFLYAAQLFFNFFWSIIFFGFQNYLLAFIWLVILWVLIILTMIAFYRLDKRTFWLLLPYLLWVTFAGYLNLGVYLLNG